METTKKNGFLIFIVILIIGIGLVIFLSYKYIEKPKQIEQETTNYTNLSIANFNSTGQMIKSNITLLSFGSPYYSGQTLEDGYLKVQVLENSSIDIYAESKDIYTSKQSFQTLNRDIKRVEINSTNIGNVSISSSGIFFIDNPMNLKIDVTGTIRNPIICFRWSLHIINVEIQQLNTIDFDPPKRIVSDRCYFINNSISNEELNYQMNYNRFGESSDDYIEVILIDGDITSYSNNVVLYEDKQGNDIFMNDTYYKIQ